MVNITNTKFYENKAEYAGALLLNNQERQSSSTISKFFIDDSEFHNNTSSFAGAIYMKNEKFSKIYI